MSKLFIKSVLFIDKTTLCQKTWRQPPFETRHRGSLQLHFQLICQTLLIIIAAFFEIFREKLFCGNCSFFFRYLDPVFFLIFGSRFFFIFGSRFFFDISIQVFLYIWIQVFFIFESRFFFGSKMWDQLQINAYQKFRLRQCENFIFVLVLLSFVLNKCFYLAALSLNLQ